MNSSISNDRTPLGVGIVGAGMVGQTAHLANLVNTPECRVLGLAELRPELRRRVAERFGVPRTHADHRALLADPEIEAVVVVTRRPATGPVTLDCLNAGRHVLSEKPMAHTADQGRRLTDAARANGRVYAIGHMKRHDAGYRRFKETFDGFRASGELGAPVFIRAYSLGGAFACGIEDFVMTDEPRPDGLELWPEGPGWLPPHLWSDYAWFLNVHCHDLNILRDLMGCEPVVRHADLGRSNGRLVAFDWGICAGTLEMAEVPFDDWREGVDVLFERGRLSIVFPPPLLRQVPATVTLERPGRETATLAVPWSWSFALQTRAFIDDARLGRHPRSSGDDAVNDLILAEAIWRRALGEGLVPTTSSP